MRTLSNLFDAPLDPRILATILSLGLLVTLTLFGFHTVSAQADAGTDAVAPGLSQEAGGEYLVHGLDVEGQKEADAIREILNF